MKHPYLDDFGISPKTFKHFEKSISLKLEANGHRKIRFTFLNANNTKLYSQIDYLGEYQYTGANLDALLVSQAEPLSSVLNVHIYIDPIAALVGMTLLKQYDIKNTVIVVLPEGFSQDHILHLKDRFQEVTFYEHFVDHRYHFLKSPLTTQKALYLESLMRGQENRFDIEIIDTERLYLYDKKKAIEIVHLFSDKRIPSLARYFFNANHTGTPKQIPKKCRCRPNGVYDNTTTTTKYYT